jgi:C2H2 type zinc finger protein
MNKCEKCNKEFKRKEHLINHLNRKISCIKEIIKCNNCLKIFKTKQHLENHNNRKNKCKKIDLERENLELRNRILELENLNLRNSIIPASTPIINNIMNNTLINNKIQINNFGEEKIKKIKKEELEELNDILFRTGFPEGIKIDTKLRIDDLDYTGGYIKKIDIFKYFIELIYKNELIPENTTIKYDNNNKKIYYYKNKEWHKLESEKMNDILKVIVENIGRVIIKYKIIRNEDMIWYLTEYIGDDYEDVKDDKIDKTNGYIIYNSTPMISEIYIKTLRIILKNNEAFKEHNKNIIEKE